MDGSENHPKPANRAYLDQSHVMRICLIQQQTDWNNSLRFVAIFFFRIANLKFSYLSSINGDAAWFEELNNWLSVCAPRMTMAISLCLPSRSLTERQTDMPILHVPLEENSLCARASTAATVNFRSAVRAGFELLMKVRRGFKHVNWYHFLIYNTLMTPTKLPGQIDFPPICYLFFISHEPLKAGMKF